MNTARVAVEGAKHHWRSHAGVITGAAIAAAVLIGGLILGDSVRATLRDQALARIGDVESALITGDRFVNDDLPQRMGTRAAAAVIVRGVSSTTNGDRTALDTQVLGVTSDFFNLAPTLGDNDNEPPTLTDNQALLSERLATQLNASIGDTIIVRVEQPSALPRDAVLGTLDDVRLAIRIEVAGIATTERFGRFSLAADQVPPMNLFVDRAWLQEQIDLGPRANLILDPTNTADDADPLLAATFDYADAQLDIIEINDETRELRSDRILMSPLETAALDSVPRDGVLTYFVNALKANDNSTPYSMVAAVGPMGDNAVTPTGAITAGLADDEAIINQWLADDLGATVGDDLTIDYFVLDENDRLVERTRTFTIARVVAIEGAAADGSLMPEFPGIADAESSRDWEPGIPIDLGLIEDEDEAYWDTYRGTPKAFVTLAAGQDMWSSLYGDLTAVRFSASQLTEVEAALTTGVAPASLGLFYRDLRAPALDAAKATTDFSMLFISLSFVLIASALLLMSMLFVFNIELRAPEVGTMLAIGLRRAQVRSMLLGEGSVMAIIGALLGIPLGIAFTAGVLRLLSGIWSGAVASASIKMSVSPATIAIGVAVSLIAAAGSMYFATRGLLKRSPVALMRADLSPQQHSARKGTIIAALGGVFVLGSIALAFVVDPTSQAAPGGFFGSGALLLTGGLLLGRTLFAQLDHAGGSGLPSLGTLGVRGAARRIGRSVTTVTLIAMGVFLVVSIALFRTDPLQNADQRSSGTGGFALIAESSIPIPVAPDETRGRELFGLFDEDLEGVSFVPMRVRPGDDASCLNLNAAQNPRLVGVNAAALAERGAFSFKKSIAGEGSWDLLLQAVESNPDAVPAIIDDATATWAMHVSVGDTVEYVDAEGRPFDVVVVGTIGNSILQGSVLISERRFRELYPRVQGYQMMLVDAPAERADGLTTTLSRAMGDLGIEIVPAVTRLAEYSAVQNTYLTIFQMLGGLGLVLGTLGLAAVVLRNGLERRRELAVMRVLGIRGNAVNRMMLTEHALLLGGGLVIGTVAAVVAVIPSFVSSTQSPPLVFALALLGSMVISGLVAIWIATRAAAPRDLVGTLAREG